MRISYSPGRWAALIQDGSLLLLPAETDAALIAEIWDAFEAVRDLGSLVDLLTARTGGTFTGLPDFAAVMVDGAEARIAVRGEPIVVAETGEGQSRTSGSDVTTWNERLLRGVTRVDVMVESAVAATLPLIGGVVHVASVSVEVVEGAGRAPVAAPAAGSDSMPVAETVAAPAPSPVVAPAPSPVAAPVAAPIAVVPPISGIPGIPSIPDLPARPDLPTEAIPTESEPSAAPADETAGDDLPVDTFFPSETINPDDVPSSSDIDEFDMLWGDTVHRPSVADAVGPDAAGASAATSAVQGDHDGATISVAELRAMRRDAAPVSPEAPTVALPIVGGARVHVSTGQVVTLDRTVIIGRRPRSTRASGANLPHLIAVESPQQDISRSHLEIRPEGDTILVTDLHTTNGSTLLRQGVDPVRLHPGEQTLVLSGDVVDLGDGVTVSFEELP